MKRLIALIALLVLVVAAPACAEEKGDLARLFEDVKPVPLFDGKTFDGWEGDMKWFRIEDGAIVAGSMGERIPHNQFLCTVREFGDFELRLSAKLEGESVNGGVQFRSKRVPDTTEVSGYQADLGQQFWGCLYDEARRNRLLVAVDAEMQQRVARPDDWNHYIIRAVGNRIQLVLNGVTTVDYTEPDDAIPRTGVIGVQIHSGSPAQAFYKDIMIKSLPRP